MIIHGIESDFPVSNTGSTTTGSPVPRRPWVLSKQYLMTFVLSQDNDIIIPDSTCKYLGDDVLRHIISAVNSYTGPSV